MRKCFRHEEEPEEKDSEYLCRCHQCGEEFMAIGVMMEGFASVSFLLMRPKECPKCGSFKIKPVMFDDDEFYVERYQRIWEEKEMRAKEQEE
jgi:ribosomal protein S27AE